MEFERQIKRLAMLLVASLVVIFIAKMLLGKAATGLSKAAADKKAQAAAQQVAPPPAASQPIEAPVTLEAAPASTVAESAVSAASEPAATR